MNQLGNTNLPQVKVLISVGDAIELYNHLHTIIRRNREEFDDQEISFLARIKQVLSEAVAQHDNNVLQSRQYGDCQVPTSQEIIRNPSQYKSLSDPKESASYYDPQSGVTPMERVIPEKSEDQIREPESAPIPDPWLQQHTVKRRK